MSNTLEFVRSELREDTAWQLHASVECAGESESIKRNAHPRFAEDCVVLLQVALNGTGIDSTNCTTGET